LLRFNSNEKASAVHEVTRNSKACQAKSQGSGPAKTFADAAAMIAVVHGRQTRYAHRNPEQRAANPELSKQRCNWQTLAPCVLIMAPGRVRGSRYLAVVYSDIWCKSFA
jgi:hypothetical protein